MSNFSRDTTIAAFCQPSFILRSQCALYLRVCSISRLFLCAMTHLHSVLSLSNNVQVSLDWTTCHKHVQLHSLHLSSMVCQWGHCVAQDLVLLLLLHDGRRTLNSRLLGTYHVLGTRLLTLHGTELHKLHHSCHRCCGNFFWLLSHNMPSVSL